MATTSPESAAMMYGMPNSGLRIFGDASKFRRKVQDRIRVGEHLLDEFASARERLMDEVAHGLEAEIHNDQVGEPVRSRVALWRRGNFTPLANHLGAVGEALCDKAGDSHPSDSFAVRIDQLESVLQTDLAVLRQLLVRIPARRALDAIAPVGVRLSELWASGLLDPDLLRSYEERMAALGTRRKVAVAIGAAKELVESTLKAALQCFDEEPPRPRDDFQAIAKRVRVALKRRSIQATPDVDGVDTLDLFQAHLAGLLQDLDEWRNLYGAGHGRTTIPRGLAARHGRLAVDVAETYVRFLVTTLNDLGLLRPSGVIDAP